MTKDLDTIESNKELEKVILKRLPLQCLNCKEDAIHLNISEDSEDETKKWIHFPCNQCKFDTFYPIYNDVPAFDQGKFGKISLVDGIGKMYSLDVKDSK